MPGRGGIFGPCGFGLKREPLIRRGGNRRTATKPLVHFAARIMAGRPTTVATSTPEGATSLLRIARKGVGDLSLFLGALVEDHAITELERVPFFHRVIAVFLAAREIMQSPRIRGKQAIRAHVPVRRIAEA